MISVLRRLQRHPAIYNALGFLSARVALKGSLFGAWMTGAIVGDALDQKREHDIDACRPVAAEAAVEAAKEGHDPNAAAVAAGLACMNRTRGRIPRFCYALVIAVIAGLVMAWITHI